MIDSNDRERIDEAREELYSLVDEDELKNCVLLILANKQVNLVLMRLSHALTVADRI